MVEEPAYSTDQATAWLQHIRLPTSSNVLLEYTVNPSTFTKTYEALRTLMRRQISRFPMRTFLIFFYHMLRALGFRAYMTRVRNRSRMNGVQKGEYQGLTHINNIVHLPSGQRFSIDVGFGGDGPTSPLPLDEQGLAVHNLGRQEVRLIHDNIPKQRIKDNKLWIYQYLNAPENDWNSFYSFAELEFFQEDFEVLNLWGSAKTLHPWTVLVVRFLRPCGRVKPDNDDIKIVGKVMLVGSVVKVNLGGKTSIMHSFGSEEGRMQAFKYYFDITLMEQEAQSVRGWDKALG
ncbi:hypothetical protein ASPSYDRAFT_57211 [Aspergillus sydowii CBS 593.65]|uniref:Uncharacterized protein n=1 Tax=Aspergillus sydowii CBS 593.65 TaxID=1036612 RepID=A0A1L9TJR0_9EURO|nr:uncharacterized protein ASPSYDRAFT_57211 [Aspergillus sydowii CBS 593.65]OJJ59655.1 hypothetical protein ASPSYDRAFT_57211 [Aspergillus sydowii CBS 593.65]